MNKQNSFKAKSLMKLSMYMPKLHVAADMNEMWFTHQILTKHQSVNELINTKCTNFKSRTMSIWYRLYTKTI